jgi:phosphoglycolate phosphatase-like HAD superfamily hydrolase
MGHEPLILFDMDGVLVDVTGSYREVTRLSVLLYLREVVGAHIQKRDFLPPSDVSFIKKRGGLNNDWDLTDSILNAFLLHSLSGIEESRADAFIALRTKGDDTALLVELRSLLEGIDLSALESLTAGSSAREVFRMMEDSEPGGAGRRSPLLMNQGDVGTGNLSKRIFQEIYLGRELFEEIYGEKPILYRSKGYIVRERMIPDEAHLGELATFGTLAIATGRPDLEARYALRRFGIEGYFRTIVSEDDVVEAEKQSQVSLRKPDPFSLRLCVKRSGWRGSADAFYVGDMPDDIIAARRADMTPIGFVNSRSSETVEEQEEHRALLMQRGAEAVFGNFEELSHYLLHR